MQTKTIEGKTLFGEVRTYTFNLMNAEAGLRLFHEIVPMLVDLLPSASIGLDTLKADGTVDFKLLEIVRELPKKIPWERLAELARLLLAGHTVKIDAKTHTAGESGIGDYTLGDPLEVYTALFYGLVANYPKYLDPLLSGLSGDDTSPGQTKVKIKA